MIDPAWPIACHLEQAFDHSPADLGPPLADLADRLAESVVAFRQSHDIPARYCSMARWDAAARSPVGKPFKPDRWHEAVEALRCGRLRSLTISAGRPPTGTAIDAARAEFWIEEVDRPGAPNRILFKFTVLGGAAAVSDDMQREVVELFCDAAVAVQAVSGFITLDATTADRSPYEVERHVVVAGDRWRENVRGYYWGTLLGPRHVELLGGLAHVESTAPGIVRVFHFDDGPRVFVQATPHFATYAEGDMAAMRAFLLPLFPSGPGVLARTCPPPIYLLDVDRSAAEWRNPYVAEP